MIVTKGYQLNAFISIKYLDLNQMPGPQTNAPSAVLILKLLVLTWLLFKAGVYRNRGPVLNWESTVTMHSGAFTYFLQ